MNPFCKGHSILIAITQDKSSIMDRYNYFMSLFMSVIIFFAFFYRCFIFPNVLSDKH